MANNLFNLAGKVALITGGSKGLGKAMARGLAEVGADVVISSRTESELRPALQEILEGTGRKGHYLVADMSKREDVTRLARTTLEKMGRVDILVNNAGTNEPQPIDRITDEVWDRVLEINLHSVMALTRALVPQMKERRWGRIIHISSVMAFVSKEGRDVYSTTKSALVGLARANALDLGPHGITVNCIAPGPFMTDLPGRLLSDEEKRSFASRTALGRWGEPNELIGPVLALATEAGSYITGQTLVVDGGYLAALRKIMKSFAASRRMRNRKRFSIIPLEHDGQTVQTQVAHPAAVLVREIVDHVRAIHQVEPVGNFVAHPRPHVRALPAEAQTHFGHRNDLAKLIAQRGDDRRSGVVRLGQTVVIIAHHHRAIRSAEDAETAQHVPLTFAAEAQAGPIEVDRAADLGLRRGLAVVIGVERLIDPGKAAAPAQVSVERATLKTPAQVHVEQLIIEAAGGIGGVDGIDETGMGQGGDQGTAGRRGQGTVGRRVKISVCGAEFPAIG